MFVRVYQCMLWFRQGSFRLLDKLRQMSCSVRTWLDVFAKEIDLASKKQRLNHYHCQQNDGSFQLAAYPNKIAFSLHIFKLSLYRFWPSFTNRWFNVAMVRSKWSLCAAVSASWMVGNGAGGDGGVVGRRSEVRVVWGGGGGTDSGVGVEYLRWIWMRFRWYEAMIRL